eukprot:66725-Amphidinium_carterae.1
MEWWHMTSKSHLKFEQEPTPEKPSALGTGANLGATVRSTSSRCRGYLLLEQQIPAISTGRRWVSQRRSVAMKNGVLFQFPSNCPYCDMGRLVSCTFEERYYLMLQTN